ncbi:hypothetical protein HHL25_14180 [Rhizobium sp. S-51]|uniref:Uncharacterized protein n=1 Tax=Rhizobium terricola TaxID=2728849 RepID=A0A7Y0AXP1_9HYPH|nr:hypothetical protein [Rhizobium terricola]NML75275.1 hypothetical protein [Rhizobium terricola]
MDIAAALAIAGQAIGLVKDLREIDKGLDTAEYKAKMAELYSSLADVKMALSDAQMALREKDQEIHELRAKFELRTKLVEVDGFRYETHESGKPKGVPFCPRCEQNSSRLYRLTRFKGMIIYKCPECNAEYKPVHAYPWTETDPR